MRVVNSLLAVACLALTGFDAAAQSASTSGNSGTTCTQSGATLVCTTTTTLSLPAGTNLTGMTLPQTSATGPACASVTASPTLLDPNVATAVTLTVNGCPTSGSYTYKWGTPVTNVNQASTTYTATLSQSNPSLAFSVDVCFTNNPTACNSYSTSVAVKAPVTALSGCSITPATTSTQVGTTPSLSASCTAGAGAGSGVTYQWSRNGTAISGATNSSYTLSAASDTVAVASNTYSVQITNAAPSTAAPTATVAVTAVDLPPEDKCPGIPVRYVIGASETFRKIYTTDYVGTFTAGNDFVVQIDVATTDTTVGRFLASVGFGDYGANRGGRYVTLSKTKCDYTDNAQWVSGNFLGIKTPANSATGSIALGGDTRGADARLTPGRWFLNIQNVVGQCPSNQSCHAVIQWSN